MVKMPRERAFDSTLALLRDPYGFIAAGCRRHGSDVFAGRLLLRPRIFMSGRDAAELFYQEERFQRAAAAPRRARMSLFGEGGVQGLDGEAHRHRKAMFLRLLGPEAIPGLSALHEGWWRRRAQRWAHQPEIVLYEEARELLAGTICEWAGVPVDEAELPRRARQLAAMFEGAGAVGPRHLRSRHARQATESWLAALVEQIRAGRFSPREGSAAEIIAHHLELDGQPLAPRVAAVELINVLRPTVAIAVYATHAAHALHVQPRCRERLATGDASYRTAFVQEVRRFYPFFPAAVARLWRDFEWRGMRFRQGHRTLLDLHGIDRDPRLWYRADEFLPERFLDRGEDPFAPVPQGGGSHASGHRCAGEWVTAELLAVAVDQLGRQLSYEVPPQDLTLDTRQLPALPRSRMVLRNVRPRS